MSAAVSALYEPLLERDATGFAAAARAFREEHSLDDLWLAVTRFALLAYSPAEHARHALLCAAAAHGSSEEWAIEVARYAADARQPWSEPPILEPPSFDDEQRGDLEELREAVREGDRPRAETWLAFRIAAAPADALERDLVTIANEHADCLLVARAAIRLVPLLGDKGLYATLRVVIWDVLAKRDEPPLPSREIGELVQEVIASHGAIDAVSALLVASEEVGGELPQPYQLARDYGHLLLAHAARFPAEALRAVARNLEEGESYAEWTFA